MLLRKAIKRFLDDNRGYVIALTLISMPLLLGFSLLIIDVGRTGNLHTDLQNAVDAMALSGARELDGRDDAITRADAAIEALANSAAFGGGGTGMSLGSHITVTYDAGNDPGSTVTVTYLKEIPADDDDPIEGSMITTDPNEASYAWVVAKPQAMTTIFPVPVGLNRDTINVSADAVAVYRMAACDIAPIFICNPFEDAGKSANQAFADGDFHGALISMHLPSNQGDPAGPGNFGFLEVPDGKGAADLREYFAGSGAPMCINRSTTVTTKPGNTGSVEEAINTRFDMFEGGAVPGNVEAGPPAVNVRKGAQNKGKGAATCDAKPTLSIDPVTDKLMAFPDDTTYLVNNATSGARVGNGDWNLSNYWQTNYGESLPPALSGSPQPSRYEVYLYEIANGYHEKPSIGGESGSALCYKKNNQNKDPPSFPDRRITVAALVDCDAQGAINGKKDLDIAAFAKVFLTRPVKTQNNLAKGTATIPFQYNAIDIEIVDITGFGGRGSMEEYLREEAELVR
ncbi:TadE/TadG family type IV pilus assembly protein [Sinorhizobium fredii]|uniref:TadE/TadG family type IV pilus assembly protein n=1 Tax=Rhizobium fredii TaxID=380 RepID=UPI000694289E|nr:TadE/TadG family type IV pilus assembly protein [Sinorhizobium fredii]WOS65169.1 TadE/TadG family type IV pilus assembly protein [Sinorhizobium fredii GR64]